MTNKKKPQPIFTEEELVSYLGDMNSTFVYQGGKEYFEKVMNNERVPMDVRVSAALRNYDQVEKKMRELISDVVKPKLKEALGGKTTKEDHWKAGEAIQEISEILTGEGVDGQHNRIVEAVLYKGLDEHLESEYGNDCSLNELKNKYGRLSAVNMFARGWQKNATKAFSGKNIDQVCEVFSSNFSYPRHHNKAGEFYLKLEQAYNRRENDHLPTMSVEAIRSVAEDIKKQKELTEKEGNRISGHYR